MASAGLKNYLAMWSIKMTLLKRRASMELHFFPGQDILAVKKGARYIAQYNARGGPAIKRISSPGEMPEEPTWPGVYIIDGTVKYSTPTWKLSTIKWGVKLVDKPDVKPDGDVYYELPNKRLASVLKDVGVTRKQIISLNTRYYRQMGVPKRWLFNDFGPIAIRWFKDMNGNKLLDRNERLEGQMFHTTPENEGEHARGPRVFLQPSHGCIHLKPADRDFLLGSGAFAPKTVFIVHEYNETI